MWHATVHATKPCSLAEQRPCAGFSTKSLHEPRASRHTPPPLRGTLLFQNRLSVRDLPACPKDAAQGRQTPLRCWMCRPDGRVVPVRIAEITDEKVILDANHPLAGKNLNFEIELLEIVSQN